MLLSLTREVDADKDSLMVKILKHTTDYIDGISLAHYLPGRVYDLPPLLADYLVMQGYAVVEMRRRQRSHRFRMTDRRRPSDIPPADSASTR